MLSTTHRSLLILKRVKPCMLRVRWLAGVHGQAVKPPDKNPNASYFKEFMKLLKGQKEPPFLYSSVPHLEHGFLDLSFLRPLSTAIKEQQHISEQSMFAQLGVSSHYENLLKKNGIIHPTPVQKTSFPELLRRKSAIIESETGSGKTLTYLIPVLQNLGSRPCSNIIIVPTRELAAQVYNETLKYVGDRRQVVRYVSGIDENQERKLDRALRESHVVIATPTRLMEILEKKSGHFRNVKRIVLDEVDKLLPVRSMFKTNMNKTRPAEKVLSMLLHHNKHAQLIATSATVSNFFIQELQDRGFTKRSRVIKCSPEGYRHGKIPENIQHNFVVANTVKGTTAETEMGNKVVCIARLFRQSGERSILVFIPKQLSVQSVVSAFQDMNFAAVALYKKVLLPSTQEFEKFVQAFEEGDIEIVVSTEETVRGMDFPFVKHAYLTYVPATPEDYVHVAGRVGRASRQGVVTTVLNEADEERERKQLRRRLSTLKVKGRKIAL